MKSGGGRLRLILTIVVPALILAGLVTAQTGGLDTVADAVLGQPDFAHNSPNAPDGSSIAQPGRVAVDRSVSPNRLYLADTGNNRVLAWRSIGSLVNGESADLVIGQPDFLSISSGASASSFRGPVGVAVDSTGNLYVADSSNNRVLEFTAPFSGCASFPCVGGSANLVFGQNGNFTTNGCNGNASATNLCDPTGVAVDANGNVYIADSTYSRVLEYNSPLAKTSLSGSGDTIADSVFGQGSGGNSFTTQQCDNGEGGNGITATSLCEPQDVAVDAAGNVYIADSMNQRVLEYGESANPPANFIPNTVFGQGGSFTTSGCREGAAGLCGPTAVSLDELGNLYIADYNRVLEFNTPLKVTSTPGSGDTIADTVFGQADDFTSEQCNLGGSAPDSDTLCSAAGVAVDAAGDVFVSDQGNNRLLQYDIPLATDTVADVVLGQPDFVHSTADAPGPQKLNIPLGAAVDTTSTPNHLYIADTGNSRVLGWLDASTFAVGAAAELVIGQPDFFSRGPNNNGVSASSLSSPSAVSIDSQGNLYVSDTGNNRVLEFPPPFSTCASPPCVGGTAIMVFGQLNDFTASDCNLGASQTPTADTLCSPKGIALDSSDDLYIADDENNRVLEFNIPRKTVSGVAGSGDTVADAVFGQGAGGNSVGSGVCNNGGLGTTSLCNPTGVGLDSSANIYIADSSNSRVLEYNESSNPPTNFTASVAFGQQRRFDMSQCNNGGITANSLCDPTEVVLDPAGDLFVSDTDNSRVLEFLTPLASLGPTGTGTTAMVVFGQPGFSTGSCNITTNGVVSAQTLCEPSALALDSKGDLIMADADNSRVLRYNQMAGNTTPTPSPTPILTASPTRAATPTTTGTGVATPTRTLTPTATTTATSTRTATSTPTRTTAATATATPTATPSVVCPPLAPGADIDLTGLAAKPVKLPVIKPIKFTGQTTLGTNATHAPINLTLPAGLIITGVTSSSPDFAVPPTCVNQPLACSLSVGFHPSKAGASHGTLTIANNMKTITAALSGSGVGPKVRSLSQRSAPPLANLTLNGSGFEPGASALVNFAEKLKNGTPVAFLVPGTISSSGSAVQVQVPPIFDPTSLEPINGTATLTITELLFPSGTKLNSTSPPLKITPYDVADTLPPGSATIVFLQKEETKATGLAQMIMNTPNSPLSGLVDSLNTIASSAASLLAIISGNPNATLGTIDGMQVTESSMQLQNADAYILSMLNTMAGNSSGGSAAARVRANAGSGCLAAEAAQALADEGNPTAFANDIAQLFNDAQTSPACMQPAAATATLGIVNGTSGVALAITAQASNSSVQPVLPAAALLLANLGPAGQLLSVATSLAQTSAQARQSVQGAVASFNTASQSQLNTVVSQSQGPLNSSYSSSNQTAMSFNAATPPPLDGTYAGSFTGTQFVTGACPSTITGSLGYTVQGSTITVTIPGAGSGTLDPTTGIASFQPTAGIGGANVSCSFGGTLLPNQTGPASASGTWSCSSTGPGSTFNSGNGTWTASQTAP